MTSGYYFDFNSGQLGRFKSTGHGDGIDSGLNLVGSLVLGDAATLSGNWHNDNASVGFLTGSLSFTPDKSTFTAATIGLTVPLPIPITGSATNTTTVVYPIFSLWGSHR